MKMCSEPGCGRQVRARGFCALHYDRARQAGLLDLVRPHLPMAVRFLNKIDTSGGMDACWAWQGWKSHTGYGYIDKTGRASGAMMAHRFSYEFFIGRIPEGMHVDHLCHTQDGSCFEGDACPHRSCVNPRHLEPVTPHENVLRARGLGNPVNRAKTRCPQGHPYDKEYRGERMCSVCRRAVYKRYRERRKAALWA